MRTASPTPPSSPLRVGCEERAARCYTQSCCCELRPTCRTSEVLAALPGALADHLHPTGTCDQMGSSVAMRTADADGPGEPRTATSAGATAAAYAIVVRARSLPERRPRSRAVSATTAMRPRIDSPAERSVLRFISGDGSHCPAHRAVPGPFRLIGCDGGAVRFPHAPLDAFSLASSRKLRTGNALHVELRARAPITCGRAARSRSDAAFRRVVRQRPRDHSERSAELRPSSLASSERSKARPRAFQAERPSQRRVLARFGARGVESPRALAAPTRRKAASLLDLAARPHGMGATCPQSRGAAFRCGLAGARQGNAVEGCVRETLRRRRRSLSSGMGREPRDAPGNASHRR